jgi:hypothetical protein
VLRHRGAGKSWTSVAAELAAATDGQVELSGEYLRQLYGAQPAESSEPNGSAA